MKTDHRSRFEQLTKELHKAYNLGLLYYAKIAPQDLTSDTFRYELILYDHNQKSLEYYNEKAIEVREYLLKKYPDVIVDIRRRMAVNTCVLYIKER